MLADFMKALTLCVPAVLGISGCSEVDDGLPREPVSGTVTFEGQPLKQGAIQFYPGPESKDARPGGAVIADGKFSIAKAQGLMPGSYRVTIKSGEGAATPPDLPPGTASPAGKELVPEKYNEKTVLTAVVKPGAPNQFEFTLTK
jgi:hypothetical protein